MQRWLILSISLISIVHSQRTFQNTKFDIPPDLAPESGAASQNAAPLHHPRKDNQLKPQKKAQYAVQAQAPGPAAQGLQGPLQPIPQPQLPVQQPQQVPFAQQSQPQPLPQAPAPAPAPSPAFQQPVQTFIQPQPQVQPAFGAAQQAAQPQPQPAPFYQPQAPVVTPAPVTFTPPTPATFATFTFPTFATPAPFSFPTLAPGATPFPTLPTHPTFDPLGLFAHLTSTTPSPQNLTEQWNEYYRKYYLYYYNYDITKPQNQQPNQNPQSQNQQPKPLPANAQAANIEPSPEIVRPQLGATIPPSRGMINFIAPSSTVRPFFQPSTLYPPFPHGPSQGQQQQQQQQFAGVAGPFVGVNSQAQRQVPTSIQGPIAAQSTQVQAVQAPAASAPHPQFTFSLTPRGQTPLNSQNLDQQKAEISSAELLEPKSASASEEELSGTSQVAQFGVQNTSSAGSPSPVHQISANSEPKTPQNLNVSLLPSPIAVASTKLEEGEAISSEKPTSWFQDKYDTKECRKNLHGISQRLQAKFPSYLQKGGKDVQLAGLVEQRLIECDRKSTAGHWEKVDTLLAKISLSKSEESECRAGLIQERISCVNLLNYACQFVDKDYVFRLVPARITIQEARNAEAGAEKCRKVVRLVKKRLQTESLNRRAVSRA